MTKMVSNNVGLKRSPTKKIEFGEFLNHKLNERKLWIPNAPVVENNYIGQQIVMTGG